jgi:hypothetical protein
VEKLKFLHDFSAAKSSGISNGRVLLILNCSLPPRQFLLYYDHKIEYSKVFQHIPQQFELLLLFLLAFKVVQALLVAFAYAPISWLGHPLAPS